ncbi:proteasome subunit beta type-7-like [Uloborus diversus]|uniref:proteasome subunit beta type-7-like n=1 Tax=Uloborus diversus TaxID=327109 RepID=UPI002409287E|nr:proteasome subunit beta type-7-like [Uloborus diversus]
MAAEVCTNIPAPGFKFDNCFRNSLLGSKGFPAPKTTKTGTTIVGIIYKDGVILGADTRATSDSTIADKNCAKIHYLAPNMYCCGAGTAADTDMTTNMISSQLELHRLATDRVVPVCTANRLLKQYLFRYQGYIGAALILGGVDTNGAHLFSLAPHGSTMKLPYVTMGSGSLAAMAVFERGWKPNLTKEEGQQLVRDAVAGGVFHDLGSGSNIDMCIITREGAEYIRPYDVANQKGQRQGSYRYKRGATAVLSSVTVPLEVVETTVRTTEEAMEL